MVSCFLVWIGFLYWNIRENINRTLTFRVERRTLLHQFILSWSYSACYSLSFTIHSWNNSCQSSQGRTINHCGRCWAEILILLFFRANEALAFSFWILKKKIYPIYHPALLLLPFFPRFCPTPPQWLDSNGSSLHSKKLFLYWHGPSASNELLAFAS